MRAPHERETKAGPPCVRGGPGEWAARIVVNAQVQDTGWTHWLPCLEPQEGAFRLSRKGPSFELELRGGDPGPVALLFSADDARALQSGAVLVLEVDAFETALLRPVVNTLQIELNGWVTAEINQNVLALAFRLVR